MPSDLRGKKRERKPFCAVLWRALIVRMSTGRKDALHLYRSLVRARLLGSIFDAPPAPVVPIPAGMIDGALSNRCDTKP